MIFVAKAVFLVVLAGLLWQRLHTLLTYFQQEEYDASRFFSAIPGMWLFDVRASFGLLIGGLLALAGAPLGLILVLLAVGLAYLIWEERGYRYKKPLVLTQRAWRILVLAAVFMGVPWLASGLSVFLGIVALQLVPVSLAVANLILTPFQTRVNEGYVAEARTKLARMDPVRIGITGSFGKTTVKHILADVLEAGGPVFYSRGSINTVLGLTRHIRQRLQWSHRYFIAEMGAYGLGSIKRLCDFAQPTWGIVTAVGDAHTERFGGIDVIARAKSELVREVCKRGGRVVINAEVLRHAPFAKLREEYGDQVVSVGEGADVRVAAEALDTGGWRVTLGGAVPDVTYDLPLLGDHNIMNSALAVSLTLLIAPDVAGELPYFTANVAQIQHRLQKVEDAGAPLILDDAYNANEAGFKAAVTVMKDLAVKRSGRAILVTPGIAELGLEHDRVHDRLGRFCNDYCDVTYVVNPSRIRSFTAALDGGRMDLREVASFAEARAHIAADHRVEDVILYENDLPDVLEEPRFL